MIKYILLPVVLLTLPLTGCISGGVGSADFSLEKFFSNPIIIVAVIGLIIYLSVNKRK